MRSTKLAVPIPQRY